VALQVVVRECFCGAVMPARILLPGTVSDPVGLLLHEAVELLGLPVENLITDGQASIQWTVVRAISGVLRPLCQLHFLREASVDVYETDRHAKEQPMKRVRCVRPIEGTVERRRDHEDELALCGCCAAWRAVCRANTDASLDMLVDLCNPPVPG
jgi:hypothetical protein